MVRFKKKCRTPGLALSLLLAGWASPLVGQDLEFLQVASGLSNPVAFTHAGDGTGRLFVLEQVGRIRIIRSGTLLNRPFLDITNLVRSGNERGLLGLAFHPDFAVNRRFFVNYTRQSGGQLQTVVAEYRAFGANPDQAETEPSILLVFDQPFINHNGGHLAFGPDGFLYIATGDGGSGGDPFNAGQRRETLLGKILRIDVDGGQPFAIPPTNPFLGEPDVRPEIWAYGLRNPWRFSFDRLTGRLLAGDVGQNRWEEVDLIVGGGNYGWNVMEGPDCFQATACDTTGLALPIFSYGRLEGAAVIGGYVYRGQQRTRFQGHYVFGDFISQKIWALEEAAGGAWRRILELDTPFSISSFGEDEEGNLYLTELGGTVQQLVFEETALPPSITLSLQSPSDLALVGDYLVLEAVVSNQGGSPSSAPVTLSSGLPEGFRLDRIEAPGWDCQTDGQALTCVHEDPLDPASESRVRLRALVSPEALPELASRVIVEGVEVDPEANQATQRMPVLRSGDLPLNFDQLALGDGYRCILIVSNVSERDWQGRARLRMGNDRVWSSPVRIDGQELGPGGQFQMVLDAKENRKYVLEGDQELQSGYLELRGEPGFPTTSLAVSFFYNLSGPTGLLDSTGSPSQPPSTRYLFGVERSATANTGFAWAPFLDTSDFGIMLQLYDTDGTLLQTRRLAYDGHLARFFTEVFENLPAEFVGLVEIQSEKSLFLTVLRLEFSASGGQTFELTSSLPERGY